MDAVIRELERKVAQGDMRAAVELGRLLIDMGRAAAAIPILQQALALYPEAQALLDRARAVIQAAEEAAQLQRWIDWVRGGGLEFAKRAAGAVARAAHSLAKLLFQTIGALLRLPSLLLRLPLPLLLAAVALLVVLGLGAYLLLRSKPVASPYCDCTHVNAGLLTPEYREDCRKREAELVALTAKCGNDLACVREALGLKTGPDGRLVSGKFCDSVTCGEAAWPLAGSLPVPPPRPVEGTPCVKTAGISRECR